MKKKILVALILTFLSLLLWGIGKLYIAYNLSHYAGYYVQHMPRKDGTNPEMVIVLRHLNDIEKPTTNNLSYDFDGNGAIILDNSIVLSRGTYIRLRNYTENKKYIFNNFGSYSFYYTDDIDKKNMIRSIKKRRNYFLIKSYLLS
ncbi:hypothetical protein [Streptococcus suis]|uniref:hypothetical protein n=1 Tax=Streptococcus suis TaxID=1307 RepID=UPI00195F6F04|nr:hypothetical protein [Streptococcus suis]MBM7191738.1 hypothetical protein [Streptococcus suis]MCO8223992.1 hypothetical protein [Streptococcus suis]